MYLFDLIQFSGCRLESIQLCGDTVKLKMATSRKEATCPKCGKRSESVHSYYLRHPADLPIGDKFVQLQLRSRRFRCANGACPKVTFAERLPQLLPEYARRTSRLTEAIFQAGLELGGQAATRLLPHLRIAISRDTVLRILRREFRGHQPEPSIVIGIDDWAIRKQMTYGLIVVDLLNRRVIDLLPSRSSETTSEWLRQHPEVEIVARDRSQELRDGITNGAPRAVQVADRFHLLQNLTDTLYKTVQKRHGAIKKLVKSLHSDTSDNGQRAPEPPATVPDTAPTAADFERRARIEQARQLHGSGWTMKAIAEEMGRHPKTIGRYLRIDEADWAQNRRNRKKLLDPYKSYLLKRWEAGCRKGTVHYEEIKALGYQGKITLLRDFLRQLKQNSKAAALYGAEVQVGQPRVLSLRQLAFSMGRPEDTLGREAAQLVRLLHDHDAILAEAIVLGREFTQIVNRRDVEGFEVWLARARVSRVLSLQRFAKSLERDVDAVIAALELSWSNGPTEGFVNRLKLIKRHMYGRAKLDLLRIRVIGAQPP